MLTDDLLSVTDVNNMSWYDRLGMFLGGSRDSVKTDIEQHGTARSPWSSFGEGLVGQAGPVLESVDEQKSDDAAGTSFHAGLGVTGGDRLKMPGEGMVSSPGVQSSGQSLGRPAADTPEPALEQVNQNPNNFNI